MGKINLAVIIYFLFTGNADALTSIESLIHGKFFERFPDKIKTFNLFKQESIKAEKWQERRLKVFRAFYQEGEHLANLCQKKRTSLQMKLSRRQRLLQSYVATLQHVGLESTTKRITRYAFLLDFSADEFQNLIEYL
ncbi:MAG: hypothetical protein OXB84_01565, partial [Halobacteriovoraceae bacterium]|nr:hypothetical protein [Halobacteriovoraceae bacterium]